MKTNNYLFALLSSLLLVNTAPLSAEPTPTTTPQTATPGTTAPITIQPQVSRAGFTSTMLNREPTDQLSTAQTGQVINYFSELKGLQGHVITHRWEHNGHFKLGMQFPVNGQRWRVHSSKTLHSNMAGTWTVSVVNDDGSVLKKDTLTVTSSASGTPPATTSNTSKTPETTTVPARAPKAVQPKKAETASPLPQNTTSTPTEPQTKPAAKPIKPTQSVKPVKPLMPELLEVQPPELTPSAKPATAKVTTNPTDPVRKPIWEVLPQ